MRKVGIKKTIDKNPIIFYEGRSIEIRSNGFYHNTQVKVNGQELRNVHSLVLRITPQCVNIVEMELLDLGPTQDSKESS
jgi:hypothetical protein